MTQLYLDGLGDALSALSWALGASTPIVIAAGLFQGLRGPLRASYRRGYARVQGRRWSRDPASVPFGGG